MGILFHSARPLLKTRKFEYYYLRGMRHDPPNRKLLVERYLGLTYAVEENQIRPPCTGKRKVIGAV